MRVYGYLYKIFTGLLLFALFQPLHAQFLKSNWQMGDSTKFGVEIEGGGMYQTTNLSNQFTDKFIFGGFIDESLKNEVSEKLKDRNNFFGMWIKNGATVYLPELSFAKSQNWSWRFGLYNQRVILGNISKDLFNLIFIGADHNETKAYDIKHNGFEYIGSNVLSIGVFDKKYGSSVSLSVQQAYGRQNLEIGRKSELFYADSHLFLEAEIDYASSNTNETGLFATNGWGVTTDVEWVIPVKWNQGKEDQLFRMSLLNFGGYIWSNYSTSIAVDTVYEYSGFQLEDNSFNFPDFPNNIEDSLNIDVQQGFTYSWAPAWVSVAKIVNPESEKVWQAFYGVSLWSTRWNLPLIHSGVDYRVNESINISAHVSYGAFGGLRGGFMYQQQFGEILYFWLGTQDIFGLVSGNGLGRSFNSGLRFWL